MWHQGNEKYRRVTARSGAGVNKTRVAEFNMKLSPTVFQFHLECRKRKVRKQRKLTTESANVQRKERRVHFTVLEFAFLHNNLVSILPVQ